MVIQYGKRTQIRCLFKTVGIVLITEVSGSPQILKSDLRTPLSAFFHIVTAKCSVIAQVEPAIM
jgi:hypothetical protein